jgi:predicted ATPase
LRRKVQGFGGVLLQRTAPPLMAVFGLPQTLDQLPQRAVQTALAIRQLVAEAEAAARHEPVPAVRQALHLGMLLIEGQAHERAVSLAYALNVATWLHQLRREAVLIQERSEALLALCDEQGFALYRTVGSILRGWALAEQGQVVEGVAQMYESLTTRRTVGAKGTDTCYLAMLAQGYWHSGQPEAGLTVLAEALAAVDQSGVRFYEAELYRLKGELLLAQAGKGHEVQEAEACFHQALAVARRQQAKCLELRAAISLSRLWQQQGKRDAAHHLLAEIYGWFTEGFETPDLRAAKALLTEFA